MNAALAVTVFLLTNDRCVVDEDRCVVLSEDFSLFVLRSAVDFRCGVVGLGVSLIMFIL